MDVVNKKSISSILKYNDNYYLKNLMNGCILELNEKYYKDLKLKKMKFRKN